MAALNERLESGELSNFGGLVRLDVRVVHDGRMLVAVRPAEDARATPEEIEKLTILLAALPDIAGVALQDADGELQPIFGEIYGEVEVAGRSLRLTAGSFFQTNVQLLPALIRRLREESEPLAGKRIADVYGGVGLFVLFLAAGAAVGPGSTGPAHRRVGAVPAGRADRAGTAAHTAACGSQDRQVRRPARAWPGRHGRRLPRRAAGLGP